MTRAQGQVILRGRITLGVTAEQFLDVVRNGGSTFTASQDREALRDLRESLQDRGVVSDGEFLDFAKKSAIDNAVVAWIRDRWRRQRLEFAR